MKYSKRFVFTLFRPYYFALHKLFASFVNIFSIQLLRVTPLWKFSISYNHLQLGSKYSALTICDHPALYDSTFVSLGAGLDLSCDIEIMQKFNTHLVCADPTPDSIDHYNDLIASIGIPKSAPYSTNGVQSIDSYPLDGLASSQFLLIPFAIWNKELSSLEFYSHRNPSYISKSALNISSGRSSMFLPSITLQMLLSEIPASFPPISTLKIDIEGAEYYALNDLLRSSFRPPLLLVEYDSMYENYFTSFIPFLFMQYRLYLNGYRLFSQNLANFSYLHVSRF